MEIKLVRSQILCIEAVFSRQKKHQWDVTLMPFANYRKALLEKSRDTGFSLAPVNVL
jgi:hypothetical protein